MPLSLPSTLLVALFLFLVGVIPMVALRRAVCVLPSSEPCAERLGKSLLEATLETLGGLGIGSSSAADGAMTFALLLAFLLFLAHALR